MCIRGTQNAVCISGELGGLSLHVVHGLRSCTAALRRVGLENETLMSDADITAKFPDITFSRGILLLHPALFHGVVE